MKYHHYNLIRPGLPLLTCAARTKSEARGIFKQMVGKWPGQRLRMRVRMACGQTEEETRRGCRVPKDDRKPRVRVLVPPVGRYKYDVKGRKWLSQKAPRPYSWKLVRPVEKAPAMSEAEMWAYITESSRRIAAAS